MPTPATKPKTFEDFYVYQQARSLTNEIYRLTRQEPFARDFGLVDQIRRAAVSIMSNFAEGFERGSNTETIQFVYIAKGSCGEVRAQLSVACDQGYVGQQDYERLKVQCRRISGMLSNFIDSLKGSRFTGTKFKTSKHDPFVQAMEEQQRVLGELAEQRRKEREAKAKNEEP